MTPEQCDRFTIIMLRRGVAVRMLRRPPLGKKSVRAGKRDTHTYVNQPDNLPPVLTDYNKAYYRGPATPGGGIKGRRQERKVARVRVREL